ncbi:MAG: hybrid sensor histidine kinase/response regulator [Opitutae bacterium]|nr:hybrid sensor histidine kinase/response regulator [Opitutae bacterium]
MPPSYGAMTQAEHKPHIMLVDDTVANLDLLHSVMRKEGYRVSAFTGGREALVAAEKEPPDLILLDIAMPDMDGYMVCGKLKADPKLASIPVIFISALAEAEDKVKAFRCGGVDYVTKPFQIAEVRARVVTHLKLREYQVRMEQQNRQLQESFDQLRKLEQTRDSLTHMIVHDLRGPLTAIRVAMGLLRKASSSWGEQERKCVDTAEQSADTLIEMVTRLLDISRLESGKLPLHKGACDLAQLAQASLDAVKPLLAGRPATLVALEPVVAWCDEEIVLRIVGNLLGNAVKFTPPSGEVKIVLARESNVARVAVIDTGIGIPAEFHERIFEKFIQVEGAQKRLGTGLGLAFCRLAVEAHGGQIGLDSEPGRGSIFWFTLPLAPDAAG